MPEAGRVRLWLRRIAVAGGVAAALAGAAVFAANTVVLDATASRIHNEAAALPPRAAIIVPGAAVHGDDPSDVLEDRLETALAAYQARRAPLLVSGARRGKDDEPRVMRRWLMAHGVPPGDIFMDPAGYRTLDTMTRAHDVFQVKEALIVTQAFHLPRAVYLAEASGIDAVGLVADRRPYVYAVWYATREALARTLACIDVQRLAERAPYLGPAMPLETRK